MCSSKTVWNYRQVSAVLLLARPRLGVLLTVASQPNPAQPRTELALDAKLLSVFAIKPARCATAASPGLARFRVLELGGNGGFGF